MSNPLGGPRGLGRCQKSDLSDYGHVAYQIKGNETYKNMLVNILPSHIPLAPGVGSKGQLFFYCESSVAYQIHWNEA